MARLAKEQFEEHSRFFTQLFKIWLGKVKLQRKEGLFWKKGSLYTLFMTFLSSKMINFFHQMTTKVMIKRTGQKYLFSKKLFKNFRYKTSLHWKEPFCWNKSIFFAFIFLISEWISILTTEIGPVSHSEGSPANKWMNIHYQHKVFFKIHILNRSKEKNNKKNIFRFEFSYFSR